MYEEKGIGENLLYPIVYVVQTVNAINVNFVYGTPDSEFCLIFAS